MLLQVGCVSHSKCLLKGVAAGSTFITSSHAQPHLLLHDLARNCPKPLKGLELLSFKPRLWLREFLTT